MAFGPQEIKVAMRLPTLDGGLNTKVTDIGTPLNASPDCQGVLFDEFGAIRTTRGYTLVNASQISSAPIDGLSTFLDPSGDRILVAACAGSYHYQNGAAFTQIVGSNGAYTAGVDVKMLRVADSVVFGNGYSNMYRWDGTNFFRFGVPAPVSTASIAPAIGTAFSGTYNWALTYVNSAGVESDYYPIVTSYAALVPGDATIYGIPIAPASYGVDSMNLYRTTAASRVEYWKVTALSAAQTSVVDSSPDSYLISPALLDQGTPPKAKYMVYYRGRVFAAGDELAPYRLYYSNGGAPEVWPSTNFIDIEPGDGYPISAIEAFGNAIVIHKNDGKGTGVIYLLYIADSTGISDDTNWYVYKSPAAFSAVADKSQTFFKNLLFYIGRYGVYAFTGQDLARSSADSEFGRFQTEALSYNIDTDVKQWSPSALNKSAAIMFDNKIYLAVPSNSTTGTNNKIYIFDFIRASGDGQLGVWSTLPQPGVNNFVVSDGSLYAGGYDGYVYKLDSGTTYNGTAISPYFWTAAISGSTTADHRDNTKVFRILYITHECSGNWDLQITYDVDFGAYTNTVTLNLSPGGTLWGAFNWGTGTWGGGTRSKRSRVILPGAVGKIIKFKFAVTGLNQTFKIKELELEYNLRSRRG